MSKLEELIRKWKKERQEDAKEFWSERAAIREHDALFPREEAERLAMEELEKRRISVEKDRVQK